MNSRSTESVAFDSHASDTEGVAGEFMDFDGERYFAIRNVDQMDPFFMSIVSDDDHWLFISSTGGLSAGRVSPATALFPYVPVDKIHDSALHTGSKTVLRLEHEGTSLICEPFNREHDGRYTVSRNVYKNVLGNKLCFEEINHDLRLAFRYTWASSANFGFVRVCYLENLGPKSVELDLVDGLQNLLPAGTPSFAQTNASNLVDAYKWSELDEATGLAYLTLYSGITDRADPSESLKATTAFSLGLKGGKVLLSSHQLADFRAGAPLVQETNKRGVRTAYLVNFALELAPQSSRSWQIVVNAEQSQADAVQIRSRLNNPEELGEAITRSIRQGSDNLARIMASGDGFQATAEETVSVHHYANVLFNILRGGVLDDQYRVAAQDFCATIRHFNHAVYQRNQKLLEDLPGRLEYAELLATVEGSGDAQLERLAHEYLPITFGRRHGDPSRPWNYFSINMKDLHGDKLLAYQGNWRDIFQNWEALLFSYPEFVESVIAKFVNASTLDGYNPYRISKQGIDWEIEDPDDPWGHIGYWGDHQIIYLQKLLELSRDFHPDQLHSLLRRRIFCYANVPYRISTFEAQLDDPKHTVAFDHALATSIEQRSTEIGADGKLVLDGKGEVYQVNLLEKLIVSLLCKLGNLVIDGGIWLNTQRPEWNDANNALVGQGLSMVTLFYLRRYVRFLQQLLAPQTETFALTPEVQEWLADTAAALSQIRPLLGSSPVSARQRFDAMAALGQAASRYRQQIYQQPTTDRTAELPPQQILALLDDALATIDHSISNNRRDDGLYHAYNLLKLSDGEADIGTLYPMLEGQVAALSADAISPDEVFATLEALFNSQLYRPDQHSFMLYPDRALPGFLGKNHIPAEQVDAIPLLQRMLAAGDERIILRDADGCYRFNADFTNVGDLNDRLKELAPVYGNDMKTAVEDLRELYETVFRHQEFTGRSGTMFAFEGLGSIYWHMVSKLMLAVQENFFMALGRGADKETLRRMGEYYYRVREGLGFNKTPDEYGAFPTDPYSHTPKNSGASQPGMTGQVKEEVLSRFGELGVRVKDGVVHFQPALLRAREFLDEPGEFRYLDVDGNWQTISVPAAGLAFSWCQVPIIYRLADMSEPIIAIIRHDGSKLSLPQLSLSKENSSELLRRSGRIRQLMVTLQKGLLFDE
jgi:hypothetical protein